MPNEMKLCPFCGSEAVEMTENKAQGYFCACTGCPGMINIYAETKEKAIAAWNQRREQNKGAAMTRYEILKGTAEEMAYALIENSYCDSCGYQDRGLCTFDADTEDISYYEACYNAAIAWLQELPEPPEKARG